MPKLLLIVLDGLADRPLPQLNGRTPLEAAATPTLDVLAKNGKCGLLQVIPGVAPESDAAVIALLGYNPRKYYTGRGPLEAAGLGINITQGILALRCNFATSDAAGKKLIDRRVMRSLSSKESAALAAAINKNVKLKNAKFIFTASVAHRAVLVIKAKKKLSAKITNTDPAYAIRKGLPNALTKFPMVIKRCIPLAKEARVSADLINEFTEKSHKIMQQHSINNGRRKKGLLAANAVICRDAGNKAPPLYSISKHYKKKWAILADMPLEIGIGRLADMRVIKLPLPTFTQKDFSIRIKKVVAAIKKFNCIYMHIKGPDLFGHDGDYKGKKRNIADIDKYLFSPLLKKINLKNTVIAVTADHATPCSMKGHSADAVPFLIVGKGIKADSVKYFSEMSCKRGSFGRLNNGQLFRIMIKLSE